MNTFPSSVAESLTHLHCAVTLIILFATVAGDMTFLSNAFELMSHQISIRTGSEVLDPATQPGTGSQGYNMFIGVEIMMFVGFG